jgi:triosephosphate isomerase (TIM)
VTTLTSPFFEIGPKNLLRAAQLRPLAAAAAAAGAAEQVSVIITVPATEVAGIKSAHPDLLVFAQHMDPDQLGPSVGIVTAEALADAGADGVMLNHDARPLESSVIDRCVRRGAESGLMTMVCAGGLDEAISIARLHPNILLYEPPRLIGSRNTLERPWIHPVNARIAEIDDSIKVMHAGGVASPEDAYRIMHAGAEGTGSTSGVVLAPDPAVAARSFIAAARQGWQRAQQVQHSS